jgi:hypothetical protein
VPEGGELPPEEELEAMEAAERAAAEAEVEAEPTEELDLEARDAAAAAQDPEVSSETELEPSSADVAEELPGDEFDRAVDAGTEQR